MKQTILTLIGFCLGLLAGASEPGLAPGGNSGLYALSLLMALVGLSVGADDRLLGVARSLGLRALWLPLGCMAGTFAGVALACPLVPYSLWDCLAVGAGFAYYSLSSILIGQERGAELGALALLCNVSREIVTIAGSAIILRLGGACGVVLSAGASASDTNMPTVLRVAGPEWLVPAIASAMILDFSVPFWVALFTWLAGA